MLAGLEAEQRQHAALAACVAIQALKADFKRSSHMAELTAGTANLIISLQVSFLRQHQFAPAPLVMPLSQLLEAHLFHIGCVIHHHNSTM